LSFLAHLFINGRTINVLHSYISFHQNRDISNKPVGRVHGALIPLTIELSHHTDILHQMMAINQLVDGSIRYYKRDGMSKRYDYEFWDCIIARYKVSFSSTTTAPTTVDLLLSPGILRIGDAVHKKPWHVTDLEALENPVYEGGERLPKVISQFLTDQEGNNIDTYNDGDSIVLNIQSENMHNERITVKLEDKEHDFEHLGQVLKEDTINNLAITDDLTTIELKVVPQTTTTPND